MYNAKKKNIEIKIPHITNLATKTPLNVVENKIPSVSNLVKKIDHNTKINKIEKKTTDHNHGKYITTPEFNRLTSEKFAARLEQVNLVTKIEFDNELASFNKIITSNETKHLEAEKKLDNLITKDYSFFLARIYFTSKDGSQNMFVYKSTFNMLELKIDKGTDYIISWKSKGLYKSKLIALHGAFLPYVKHFGVKIGRELNNTPLVIEEINYAPGIVNVYIVYDLDNWPKNPLRNFTLKIFCLERLI